MYEYDFSPIGKAIKRERKRAGLTREKLSEIINISPRYLISIENEGQAPSFQILLVLIRMFNISIDQYIHNPSTNVPSLARKNIHIMIDQLDDRDLIIIESTIRGIVERNVHV